MGKPENPPAFPCEAQGDRSVPPEHDYIQTGIYSAKFPGMTLRDYFAGQALAGFTSCHLDDGDAVMGAADTAKAAYNYADAMLSARQTPDREDGK